MGHYKFNKENFIYLDSCDKAIIGLIATLVCSSKKFVNEQEKTDAMAAVYEFKDVLTGKARRVADCVIDPNLNDKFKIREAARKISEWAERVRNTDNLLSEEIEVSEEIEEQNLV